MFQKLSVKHSVILVADFRRRFIGLLGYEFSSFEPTTALRVLWRDENKLPPHQQQRKQVTRSEVEKLFSARDLQRLERYSKDGCAYRLILDLLPKIADLLFADKVSAIELMQEQKVVTTSRIRRLSLFWTCMCAT